MNFSKVLLKFSPQDTLKIESEMILGEVRADLQNFYEKISFIHSLLRNTCVVYEKLTQF